MTAEKEEIILGTFQAIGNMKQWIMEFNRSNDQYEIKVKEYNKEDAETGAFFNGQKTAGEAAEIIQGRIQIYVKENS